MQVMYLGRASRTKKSLPDFMKWCRVRAICDFRRIEIHFTALETRCFEKRVDSDCLGILRNFTC